MLHQVAVADDQARREHDLAHRLEVPGGHHVLEAHEAPSGNHQRHHHGEAAEHRAGDEVRREDRLVPAGDDRDREVVAHDGVHREHQRRRQPGEQEVGDLVVMPVARRPAPSEGKDAVDAPHPPRRRAVAERGKVGDEPQVPEEQRGDEVGGNGEHVPHQGALELWPDAVGARVGEEPVDGEPRPPGVQHGEERRLHHREERHRLREPVDAGAPLLLEEEEDGRDQRPGVADADPPDEVDDSEGPADRDVGPPHPDALGDRQHHGEGEEARPGEAEPDQEQPTLAGLAPDVVEQRLVDGAVVLDALEQGERLEGAAGFEARGGGDGHGLKSAPGWGCARAPDTRSAGACRGR